MGGFDSRLALIKVFRVETFLGLSVDEWQAHTGKCVFDFVCDLRLAKERRENLAGEMLKGSSLRLRRVASVAVDDSWTLSEFFGYQRLYLSLSPLLCAMRHMLKYKRKKREKNKTERRKKKAIKRERRENRRRNDDDLLKSLYYYFGSYPKNLILTCLDAHKRHVQFLLGVKGKQPNERRSLL